MSRAPGTFEECLDAAIATLGGPAEETPSRLSAGRRRRRGADATDMSGLAQLSLVEDDGLLRWVYEAPPRRAGGRRATRRVVPAIDGVPIRRIPIEDLPSNQVTSGIEALDRTLTPHRGVRLWQGGKLVPLPKKPATVKRALLFVHGTFSKSDMFFEELGAHAEGRAYLAQAEKRYSAIVAFDHPTLSVSPWINALDLEAGLAGLSGEFDVVCHSRGGLVVAWWLRLSRRNVKNVVFVGSPLAGTSLASPAALRQALDHLATAAKGIEIVSGAASGVLPVMTVVTGIAKAVGKVLQLGADLPIADLAVVAIPGLAAQSRVANNAEMTRLFAAPWPSQPRLHAVMSNFRPVEQGAGWKFWRRLSHIGDQIKHGAADLVFAGPNDLVVDTGSMIGPVASDGAPGSNGIVELEFDVADVVRFESSATVHHVNYFRQKETVAALEKLL